MTAHLKEFVKFRGDQLFNGAVNIDWLGTDEARARGAAGAFVFHGPAYHGVSQADVGVSHGHHLQDTATFARSIVMHCYKGEEKPFTLAIAGYGTGKSHLALTLALLLSCPEGDLAETILSGIDASDKAIGSEIRSVLNKAKQPCLVVAVNGMQSIDLTAEITRQIINRVRAAGLKTLPLDELRPRFTQAANLIRMTGKDTDVIQELTAACDEDGIDSILNKLEQQDEFIYSKVHGVFSAKGIPITAFRGESIREVIEVAAREYCGIDKPFRSILILFDEFGRYAEFATNRSHIAGSGVLQDLFEGIQSNSQAVCFVGFIQFELNAYVQRVAPEHRNEILRYVTRYQTANRVYLSINLETLIAHLIEKRKPTDLDRWFDTKETKQESETIAEGIARWFPQSQNHRLWTDPEQFHSVIRKGCWPLSAYSTWFLFHLAAAGKHLQERSALAFLGDTFDRFGDLGISDDGSWHLSPVDFWSDALQEELISSEEGGQQGSIAHAYASVEARHGAGLKDDLKRLLRAAVLASKMGLQALDRDDAIKALSELAGLQSSAASIGIHHLQDELNVLEWDEAFKEFDILGDAVPRTQFLSFVRQRITHLYGEESGKASLFASRASTWCDLLRDVECDFAGDNKIYTREWLYQGVTSSADVLPMLVKLACTRWTDAIGVEEPRGTVIYCYIEPSRDAKLVAAEARDLLRAAAKETGTDAVPILVVLLCDEEGTLGEAIAALAVLEEPMSEEDRSRFGNLIAAHKEKMLKVMNDQIDKMIKKRLYVTGLKDEIEAHRLGRTGTALFSGIYPTPLSFPFDGFTTTRGNAADSCQELTLELLQGSLDYDVILAKPPKTKNRAIRVLKKEWQVFTNDGRIGKLPIQSVARSIVAAWDKDLTSGNAGLSIASALRQACQPPFGANIASAGLLLGVFMTFRISKLAILHEGKALSVKQWLQTDIFRGKKLLDPTHLESDFLVTIGDESSEWEALLGDWEMADCYTIKAEFLHKAQALVKTTPIPPLLQYKYSYLTSMSEEALTKLKNHDEQFNGLLMAMEKGRKHGDMIKLCQSLAGLASLVTKMKQQELAWSIGEIDEVQRQIDQTRPEVEQLFPEWLARQTLKSDSPDAVGEFKHTMLHKLREDLSRLELPDLKDKLERRVLALVRNAEAVANANELVRSTESWMLQHADCCSSPRVKQIQELLEECNSQLESLKSVGKKLDQENINTTIEKMSSFLDKLVITRDSLANRATEVWKTDASTLLNAEALEIEVGFLVKAFEESEGVIEDLIALQKAIAFYSRCKEKLGDDSLSQSELEMVASDLNERANLELDNQRLPWSPKEVLPVIVGNASEGRLKASAKWIDKISSDLKDLSGMDAAEANHLMYRVNNPPPIISEEHSLLLPPIQISIEAHLEKLKLDWLLEKFRELDKQTRRNFLKIANSISDET